MYVIRVCVCRWCKCEDLYIYMCAKHGIMCCDGKDLPRVTMSNGIGNSVNVNSVYDFIAHAVKAAKVVLALVRHCCEWYCS